MKQIIVPMVMALGLLCSFTTIDKTKKSTRVENHFMLGFEIFRSFDQSPLNRTDIKIEIYDHTEQRTIFTRDYTKMPSNKFSSISYFENIPYGHDLTFLVQAPNYFAKEITITYDPACTLGTKFCVNGLNQPPYEINGEYADRYVFPLTLDSITLGEELVIPNIYYKYNSAELLPRSLWVLDSLSRIVEHNPNLAIELGGHADARGGDGYNLKLSQRRVNTTKNYLIQKIGPEAAERINAVGYGETQLINHCENGVSCDESFHQQNRRTTFKITEQLEELDTRSLEERIQMRAEKTVAGLH